MQGSIFVATCSVVSVSELFCGLFKRLSELTVELVDSCAALFPALLLPFEGTLFAPQLLHITMTINITNSTAAIPARVSVRPRLASFLSFTALFLLLLIIRNHPQGSLKAYYFNVLYETEKR
jgi:hypothetical protein